MEYKIVTSGYLVQIEITIDCREIPVRTSVNDRLQKLSYFSGLVLSRQFSAGERYRELDLGI